MPSWIKPLFVFAAIYDGVLGLAFVFAPLAIFAFYGVAPPNHVAYVQFPALLLLVFAAMFLVIAANPARNFALIPYGIALKLSYSGLAFWHDATQGIPAMWIPWAWADLAFAIAFFLAWSRLRSLQG